MDTDSVIFRYKEGEDKPETGDYLGQLADEISKDYGPRAKCKKFVSLGPKVYALEIWPENATEPIVPIKLKGITLTEKVLDIVTFQSMLNLANEYLENLGDSEECSNLSVPQMQIRPTKLQTIETKTFDKIVRAMSEKRKIIHDGEGYDTLPYGYCDKETTVKRF